MRDLPALMIGLLSGIAASLMLGILIAFWAFDGVGTAVPKPPLLSPTQPH